MNGLRDRREMLRRQAGGMTPHAVNDLTAVLKRPVNWVLRDNTDAGNRYSAHGADEAWLPSA